MSFVPLKVRSHYSLSANPSKNILLQSLNRPNNIAEMVAVHKYPAVCLSDLGSASGAISFFRAVKDVCECGKQKDEHENGKGKCRYKNGCEEYRPYKIKPIIGSDFFVSVGESLKTIQAIAPNLEGWKSLLRLTSLANSPERFNKKPTIQVSDFQNSGLICVTGQAGSILADSLFQDTYSAYFAKNYEQAKSFVSPTWKENALKVLKELQDVFGKENVYIEVNFQDVGAFPATQIIGRALRAIAKEEGVKVVANTDSYYPKKDDAADHRLIVCSGMELKLSDVADKMVVESQAKFFKSNNYHIPSLEELRPLYSEDEIQESLNIAERCETYNVFGKPDIPKFSDQNADELLYQLCRKGWLDTFANKIPKDEHKKYGDRIKMELDVFKEAGLANYFLIVQDYCRYAKEELKALMSPSRGSCGGSMVACLIGIISPEMDPVKNGLFFERFYNAGRNTKDKISLPDIDCDFPIRYRDKVKDYCRDKYGRDKVADMCTFGKMQGKGALKEVLRVHSACSFDEMNKISDAVAEPSKIAGELQEQREEEGFASIIQWSLENTSKLKDWCEIKDGEFIGPFAKFFSQAIRLEGLNRNIGKHASGLIISSNVLAEKVPMINDGKGHQNAGFEMNDLEAMGLVKFDILGVSMLDKMMDVETLLSDENAEIGD